MESPLIESGQSLKHTMCILSQILQGRRTGHLDCSETGWLTSKTTFVWFEIDQLSPERLEINLSLLSTHMKKKGQSSFSAQLCDLCGYSQRKSVAPIVLSPTRRAGSLMFHLNSTQESKNWTLGYFRRITQEVLTAKGRSRRIYSWFSNLWEPKQEEYTPQPIYNFLKTIVSSDQLRLEHRYPLCNFVDRGCSNAHRNVHYCFLYLVSQISDNLSPLIIKFNSFIKLRSEASVHPSLPDNTEVSPTWK